MTYTTTAYLGLQLPVSGSKQQFDTNVYNANLTKLENKLQSVEQNQSYTSLGWLPGFGGTNAFIGNQGFTSGSYTKIGNRLLLSGRLLFGSAASFGTGTPVVSGLPFNLDERLAVGHGHLRRNNVPYASIELSPALNTNGGQFLLQLQSNTSGLQYATAVTPQQGDDLVFFLDGIVAS